AGTAFDRLALLAEPTVLAGRRFGNLVLVASRVDLPVRGYVRRTASDPFRGRVVHGADLDRFVAGAAPVSDADAVGSPPAPGSLFTR
ncbi:MAG TPA: hypothetical protein VJX10_03595, partial [Pseudonocardiaceae bacterium]|nr:hypothetical protein [Pseudonocardiaceae bacterium]